MKTQIPVRLSALRVYLLACRWWWWWRQCPSLIVYCRAMISRSKIRLSSSSSFWSSILILFHLIGPDSGLSCRASLQKKQSPILFPRFTNFALQVEEAVERQLRNSCLASPSPSPSSSSWSSVRATGNSVAHIYHESASLDIMRKLRRKEMAMEIVGLLLLSLLPFSCLCSPVCVNVADTWICRLEAEKGALRARDTRECSCC